MPTDELNDRPSLFIPTYPPPTGFGEDTGLVRPVPDGVPYYLCPGIQPLVAYKPGAPLTVKVVVGNWGGGASASLAMVALWWSPALSGATIPDPDKFIGFASVPLPSLGAQSTTSALTCTMPADAPPHICLLAKVWHGLDMPSTTLIAGKMVEVANPIDDRHWAQHNLVSVQAGNPQTIQFLATNPMADAARFCLVIQPLGREKWPALSRDGHASPAALAARFRLSGLRDEREITGEGALRGELVLEAGEHRTMTLSLETFEPVRPRTFAAFEVLQSYAESGRPAGGFGIIVQGDR